MPVDRAAFDQTRARAVETLSGSRTREGHWEGELSSSALATATAVLALAGLGERCRDTLRGGIEWLVRTQNGDGGWGDTLWSASNISTTVLGWSALAAAEAGAGNAVRRAEGWLARRAGSLEPDVLSRAIADRYGADRTFSVPILTSAALAGRLGDGEAAWRRVPQLPFELAALPQRWFQWLRLPVVSYALPALIAMGRVRHFHRPSRNPAARLLRAVARRPALRLLERIQPSGGGFLEATPLTSFVVMSLVASGEWDSPAVHRGVDFILRSVRRDGSWPIDTNLATWVTTLSIGALSGAAPARDRARLRDWLLAQQHRELHPYTGAAPGGWAWTDLSGGVPDADDTAGALLALAHVGGDGEPVEDAARAGLRWLLDLQNRDGGIPTFCRGWGALPFDRSGADLTAHSLRAWIAWRGAAGPELAPRLARAVPRALSYLAAVQRRDGAWTPLWFGNERAHEEENPTYGTARVLVALCALRTDEHSALAAMRERGLAWLAAAQNEDGGWGGDRSVPSTIEETALAVEALAIAGEEGAAEDPDELGLRIARGVSWLIEATDRGARFPPSPIGLYFAKLWYFERLYPVIFTVSALRRAGRILFPSAAGGAMRDRTGAVGRVC